MGWKNLLYDFEVLDLLGYIEIHMGVIVDYKLS